ncbi:unnamed protein product [Rotaria sordida]|uniref:Uncharacterized protein n=1 Tax=Rotaria sordida TaxID=392033 RepID=A0A819F4E5_9BILA|nr:unnamed protein product [Rotaria sordida]CAF1046957.1 unnamed protein product [Rotaria sordida]CAF3861599.1 unnamed protein product [Rotaria sordida]CAF4096572.1 unnamed protein product [Rotaria sordida]
MSLIRSKSSDFKKKINYCQLPTGRIANIRQARQLIQQYEQYSREADRFDEQYNQQQQQLASGQLDPNAEAAAIAASDRVIDSRETFHQRMVHLKALYDQAITYMNTKGKRRSI